MKGEIRSLTGLRGIAAFLVILYHFGQPSVEVGMESRFHIPKGYVAVDCFFILSGFVLSYNYANGFLGGVRGGPFYKFLLKRIARIYPAYICVTCLYLLKLVSSGGGVRGLSIYDWKDVFGNVFVATGWGLGTRPVIGDAWSVSAEVVCYFIFPFIVWLMFRQGLTSAAVGLVFAIAGLWVVARSGLGAKGWLDVVSPDTFYPVMRALSGFILGMVVYQIHLTLHSLRPAVSDLLTGGAIVVALASAGWMDNEAVLLAATFLLVLGLSFDGRLARLLFANRVSMFLGRISYSLYLVHVMVVSASFKLALATDHSPHSAYWVALGIYVGLSVLLATFSYELFELRGRRLVMSLIRSRPPAGGQRIKTAMVEMSADNSKAG